MFGDVYSNRGSADCSAASPGGSASSPSPLLARLLVPGDDADADEPPVAEPPSLDPSPADPLADAVERPPRGGWRVGAPRRDAAAEPRSASDAPPGEISGGVSISGGVRVHRSSSGLFRDAPLVMPSSSHHRARYAFDPWTKVPVLIEPPPPSREAIEAFLARPWYLRVPRVRWCWRFHDPSWWVAFCYLLGSIGFATGGFSSCLRSVVDAPRRYAWLEVVPYALGGTNFLIATCTLVYTSWEARYGEPGRADRKKVAMKRRFLGGRRRRGLRYGEAASGASSVDWTLRAAVGEAGTVMDTAVTQPLRDEERSEMHSLSDAMEEARRLWLANDSWTRRRRALELVSAGLILVGVILYKVMVFTMLARCVFSEKAIPWNARKEAWLLFYPCLVGSCFFVAGSYVLWCAANRSWRPPAWPHTVPTWIAWLSLVGSVGYLVGSLDVGGWGGGARGMAPGWPTLFVGFGVGSLVFLAQSVLMIHEIAGANLPRDGSGVGAFARWDARTRGGGGDEERGESAGRGRDDDGDADAEGGGGGFQNPPSE